MTGVHVTSRPFPGLEPAPAPDLPASAAQALAAARGAIAGRAPCPPACPQCFGGDLATGRWEYFGHAIGRCEACHEPCRSTDPAGLVRHPQSECGAAA
jgi:hypothetical protein